MAPLCPRAWIAGTLGGRKDILPAPLAASPRILASERERQIHLAEAVFKVLLMHGLLMHGLDSFKMG